MKKVILITFFAISAAVTVQAQCPMCKTALESNRDGAVTKPTVGNGINKAILFLMSMPYVLLGGAGAAYYYKRKNK
ncbi:MAG: hypothetical protein P8O20_05475 [Bacteroidia bacterium]|nr:hypothetical protein [Bacteroidia bacterium]